MTLHGYSMPLSPEGRANLVPRPPWHYAGTLLVIDFVADADAVAAVLPPRLRPSERTPGGATAYFADWQYCSADGSELLDPVRSQYREFFVTVAAVHEGTEVDYCPYIYVDQDTSLGRGWIQGFPKKLGSVHVTRSVPLPGTASARLASGTRLAGTCSVGGRRIAEGSVLLQQQAPEVPGAPPHPPLITRRYFPRLSAGQHDTPAVDELVGPVQRDGRRSSSWEGAATLVFHEAPDVEVAALAPLRVGAGRRYDAAFTVDDLHFVADLRPAAAATGGL
jgi:acetoacetate decarboxylase